MSASGENWGQIYFLIWRKKWTCLAISACSRMKYCLMLKKKLTIFLKLCLKSLCRVKQKARRAGLVSLTLSSGAVPLKSTAVVVHVMSCQPLPQQPSTNRKASILPFEEIHSPHLHQPKVKSFRLLRVLKLFLTGKLFTWKTQTVK